MINFHACFLGNDIYSGKKKSNIYTKYNEQLSNNKLSREEVKGQKEQKSHAIRPVPTNWMKPNILMGFTLSIIQLSG